jgi:hypothetical protein
MVSAARFELATTSPQGSRSTWLSYALSVCRLSVMLDGIRVSAPDAIPGHDQRAAFAAVVHDFFLEYSFLLGTTRRFRRRSARATGLRRALRREEDLLTVHISDEVVDPFLVGSLRQSRPFGGRFNLDQ